MALIYCKECGKEISNDTPRCPNCGAQTMHGKMRGEAFGLLIYVVFAFVFAARGIVSFFKNVEPFFEFMDMSSSAKDWYWTFDSETRESVLGFIFSIFWLAGAVIMCFFIKKKISELESKERYHTRQAVKEREYKQGLTSEGTFERLPNGEWRCECYRINSYYTSTCACGKSRSVLEKQAEAKNSRWTCEKCDSQNPPSAQSCVRCGAVRPAKVDSTTQAEVSQNAKKFCPECGDECALTAKFCPGCGTILEPINEQND